MSLEPLKGIRVLDLTSVVVGPICTWRLGQYGAEIIKLESPEGDLMRGLGGSSPTGQHSGTYLHLNRGKRNICLDLKNRSARNVVDRLVKRADVVVSNMRPSALERLGLDSQTLLKKYPSKVFCVITGYGTNGPYAGRPTYDSVIQGASGIAGLTQVRDGSPSYMPMVICDHVAGEIAAGSILAALVSRQKTGEGCSIEVPMFETMAAFVLQEHLAQHSFDPPVGPPGDQRLLNAQNRPVQTADGWISFTINTDSQVRAFLTAIARPDLLDDPRFNSVSARAINVNQWFALRGAPLTNKSTAQWLKEFQAVDIAAQPCHTLESLRTDEHLLAVDLLGTEQHPTEGKVATIRSTIRFDQTNPALGTVSQPRGWETNEVLGELGYNQQEVKQLLLTGAAFSSKQARS
jgi:crotonobetainyl-CoA:carnitine CoA-transferase CaiB-like acyl-CoA transferase